MTPRVPFPWASDTRPDDPGAPPRPPRLAPETLEILLLVGLCLSAAANLALAVLVALS